MPDDLDNQSYDKPASLHTFLKLTCASKSIVLSSLGYYDVRRLIDIDDEEVVAKEDADDELGEEIVEACEELEAEERVGNSIVTVEPLQSIAALFEVGEAKTLKPKLHLAYHTRSDTSLYICGVLVACSFTADDTLSTSKF